MVVLQRYNYSCTAVQEVQALLYVDPTALGNAGEGASSKQVQPNPLNHFWKVVISCLTSGPLQAVSSLSESSIEVLFYDGMCIGPSAFLLSLQ